MMKWVAILAIVLLYVLHQDFWFWRDARPLVFGFLPIGLFYHTAFTVATAGALWLLVRYAWPSHLEEVARAARGERGPQRGSRVGVPDGVSASDATPSGAGGPRE